MNPSQAHQHRTAMDLDSDITLEVGGKERQDFHACSGILARSSPVFRAMLYGNFREARPTNPAEAWRVELPEDDANSVGILLNIIHCHFDLVPSTLSLPDLYNLLVVTEKYDTTKFVRPWIQDWLRPYRQGVSPQEYGLLLCVAREVGEEEVFVATANALCAVCNTSQGGLAIDALKGSHAEQLSQYYQLTDVSDSIGQIRGQMLEEAFRVLKDYVDSLRAATGNGRACRNPGLINEKRAMTCTSSRLGILVGKLEEPEFRHVFGGAPSTDYPFSINHLICVLRKLAEAEKKQITDHFKCRRMDGIWRTVRFQANLRRNLVDQKYIAYMETQAKKTGLSAE